jgi:hypothetical protein
MNDFTANQRDSNNDFIPLPKHLLLPASLGSDACPWLDEYTDFSRYRSPRSYEGYHVGIGLFVLSTVSSRRISFDFGTTHYTNLPIALVGRTSTTAKSTVAKIGKEVLKSAGLDFLLLPDTATPQKMISLMTTVVPENYQRLTLLQQERITNQLAFAGQRGWYYDEFGQMFANMMKPNGVMADFRGLFRRFDDTEDRYENATQIRGIEIVDRPFLPIVAALTPADLLPFIQCGSALWNDGFLARFAFIAPPKDYYKKGRFPRERLVIPDSLIIPLRTWHETLGIPKVEIRGTNVNIIPISPQILTLSDDVFNAVNDYGEALIEITASSPNFDLEGNYVRFPEKALRIAALFASFAGSTTIEMNHWARAREITEHWREDLHNLYSQLSENKSVQKPSNEEKVLRAIYRKGNPTRREIEQYTGLLSYDVQLAIDHLVDRGIIDEIPDGNAIRCVIAQPKNTALFGNPVSVGSVERRSVEEYNNIPNSNIKEN